jgi:branched-chain amino acid transport system permease protein
VSAGLVGLLIGLPALRIKGFYLAAITLAAHFVVMFFIITFYGLTGGVYGIAAPAPTLGDLFAIDTPERYYYLAFLSAVLSTFFAKNLARTKPGRAFVAIRDNDIAAEVMGIDLFQYKALAFFVGSVFAGLSGSLLAHSVGWISPEDFPLMRSVWMVGMLIVGGMGHCLGAILGVVFIKGIDQIATALIPIIGRIFPNVMISLPVALGQIFFALAIMFFLVFEPRGLAHRWESIKASYRIWPFRH